MLEWNLTIVASANSIFMEIIATINCCVWVEQRVMQSHVMYVATELSNILKSKKSRLPEYLRFSYC